MSLVIRAAGPNPSLKLTRYSACFRGQPSSNVRQHEERCFCSPRSEYKHEPLPTPNALTP